MKFIAFVCALFVSAWTLSAQERIVDRSEKNAPQWLGVTDPDYVVVSAEGSTLDEARSRCENYIRQSIVNSVAVHVASDEHLFETQVDDDGDSYIYRRYESRLETIAGRLPFITDISISDADTYWEERYVRNEKRTFFVFHARYPFPSSRRQALIDQFLRQDKAQYDKYLQLKNNFDSFDEIEDIDRAITDLEPLISYFFDDMRRNDAIALQRNYRQLYSHVSVEVCSDELGEHIFCLMLDGRRVTTSRTPVVDSDWATDVSVRVDGDGCYHVCYNYDDCPDDELCSIELVYVLNGNTIRHEFSFDVSEEAVHITPYGEIELELKNLNEPADSCASVVGYMTVRSRHDTPFEVTSLNISVDGISPRLSAEMSGAMEGEGVHYIEFVADGPFALSDSRSALTSGVMKIRNLKTGKIVDVRVALPYKIK